MSSQIKQTNILIFLPIFGLSSLQTHFDLLCTAIEAHKKDTDKLGLNLLYIIIDLAIVSSVGNRTSTCLMYDSYHDKINCCFIELCF